jgi:hypothetical protein
MIRHLLRIADAFAAMAGWRFAQLNATWLILGLASLGLGRYLIALNDPRYTIAYFALTLVFYYGGNTLLLGSRFPQRLIQRFGEERAWRGYQTALALMFIHQGLGVGTMSALERGGTLVLPIAPALAWALGGALFAIGFVIKLWATLLVGIDVYYYKDMFLGRPVSGFVRKGPYRVFANPMYGIGQLHGYGYAIINRSLGGLFAIALCHMLIYAFYYAVERPFIRRVFLTN